MKIRNLFILASALALFTPAAQSVLAQYPDHNSHQGAAESTAPANAKEAYEAANAKMHKEMTITLSGNPEVDFARSMIPHHQGAIDMAKIVLVYGKDPEIRKLAEDIIKAQEAEIAWMQAWLAKNAK